MPGISDSIESFILTMLNDDGVAELQRNELAQSFSCAPSQINYVLSTRFNPNRGYIIESRRGGGGYVRVLRIVTDSHTAVLKSALSCLSNGVSQQEARDLLAGLVSAGCFDKETALLIYSALSDKTLSLPHPDCDRLRSNILSAVIREKLKNHK